MPVLYALRDKLARNFLSFRKNTSAETVLLLGVPDLANSWFLRFDFPSQQVSAGCFSLLFKVDLRKPAGHALPARRKKTASSFCKALAVLAY